MIFKDFERCFKRAVSHCYDKKKIFFTIPFLFLCGVIIVFCKTLSYFASGWVTLCLIFLPIFFLFAVLYILGVFLVKIYYNEVKNQKFSYTEVIKKTFGTAIETLNISLLGTLVFFVLWIVFGFFAAIKEIPHIGDFIGVMISIVPFLIVLTSVLLCVFNFSALFFVVPVMVLKGSRRLELIREVIKNLKKNVFISISFFLFSLILIFFICFILIAAAILTKICFPVSTDYLYNGLQWFFMMIPLVVFFAPVVIFFFNISCETYNLLQTRE